MAPVGAAATSGSPRVQVRRVSSAWSVSACRFGFVPGAGQGPRLRAHGPGAWPRLTFSTGGPGLARRLPSRDPVDAVAVFFEVQANGLQVLFDL